jgi:hypothetical protein
MTSVVEPAIDPTQHKERINNLIFDSLHEHVAPEEPIAFFCECPRVGCFDTVWMTFRDYEARHPGAAGSLRRPGH